MIVDKLAALDAEDGSRVPHEVAAAIVRGQSPIFVFLEYIGITQRELSTSTGTSVSYLSEIECGHKPGSTSALTRIARALGTTLDALVIE